MRELSDQSGVPVATIKYYLREGLLTPGHRTAPNQATYDTTHLHRLRLVRAMLDLGGLSIDDTRTILTAVDSREDLPGLLTATHRRFPHTPAPDDTWAHAQVHHLAHTRGWHLDPDDTAALVTLLRALRDTGLPTAVDAYATLADALAALDHDLLHHPNTPHWAPALITTLGDPLVALLRAVALRHRQPGRLPTPQ
ncbi:DNA-binding transcriptional MerR regulator [Actinokineospora baliensis]|uniref:MerR family transcriptional regulator n=1 Tax=Actinokineospora baliensis TaxID=547056 RepID=UPI0023BA85E8|nr:MerR family transcriptional regulator [Actinokineospora baliensis]MBM7774506.1 DNA-binding transcriptional MerR regulator [Actinokineospora baliensis]